MELNLKNALEQHYAPPEPVEESKQEENGGEAAKVDAGSFFQIIMQAVQTNDTITNEEPSTSSSQIDISRIMKQFNPPMENEEEETAIEGLLTLKQVNSDSKTDPDPPATHQTPRQMKDAERKKLKRAKETPEETERRLQQAQLYKKKKFGDETEEEHKERLHRDAMRKRKERTEETPEQAAVRRMKAAEQRRNYLQNETFEKAESRRAKDAERRRKALLEETPEQARIRREKNAARRRESLKKETFEETTARRAADAARRRKYLAKETEEQKAARKSMDAARKRELRMMSAETECVTENPLEISS